MTARRVFLAIDISADARAAVGRLIEDLRKGHSDCRAAWTRADKLHITLRFLGNVAEERLDDLFSAMREAVNDKGAFELRLDSPGVFPSARQPRVLWLGVAGDLEEVRALKTSMDAAFESFGLGRDEKRFTPHLTLARIKDQTTCRSVVGDHLSKTVQPVGFRVSEITIYESRLRPGGSEYSVLLRVPLREV